MKQFSSGVTQMLIKGMNIGFLSVLDMLFLISSRFTLMMMRWSPYHKSPLPKRAPGIPSMMMTYLWMYLYKKFQPLIWMLAKLSNSINQKDMLVRQTTKMFGLMTSWYNFRNLWSNWRESFQWYSNPSGVFLWGW